MLAMAELKWNTFIQELYGFSGGMTFKSVFEIPGAMSSTWTSYS